MTELLTRPPAAAARPSDDAGAAASVWWRGCLAALWAVAVGVAILVVVTGYLFFRSRESTFSDVI